VRSFVIGKILHAEVLRHCANNSLFISYRSYIFAICLHRLLSLSTLCLFPAFYRQRCYVAPPGGACNCHSRRSAGCREVLDVHQKCSSACKQVGRLAVVNDQQGVTPRWAWPHGRKRKFIQIYHLSSAYTIHEDKL